METINKPEMENTNTPTSVKSDNVNGWHVVEEFLLTKGEGIVSKDMKIPFKPLIDFGIIIYGKKANATNRLAMKFDLERFFMRNGFAVMSGTETQFIRVTKEIFERVKSVNDQYRTTSNQEIE
jgi:hypothetical protein